MREKLATALNTSDLKQQEQDCALDKVHALGVASISVSIGAEAIHFIDALQPKSYNQLIYALSNALKAQVSFRNINRAMTHKICKLVVFEATFVHCHGCNGAKEIKNDKKLFICPTCNGSGLHRHNDRERAKALELTEEAYLKGWDKKFKVAQSVFTDKYRNILKLSAIKYY